jgi:hypothetical protein
MCMTGVRVVMLRNSDMPETVIHYRPCIGLFVVVSGPPIPAIVSLSPHMLSSSQAGEMYALPQRYLRRDFRYPLHLPVLIRMAQRKAVRVPRTSASAAFCYQVPFRFQRART